MDNITLETEPRSATGRKVRALRRQGITPLHLYGKGTDSLTLQADTDQVQKVIVQAGRNVPVSVSVKGSKDVHFAFIREMQRHPLTEAILHVDFIQVPMAELMRAQVPVYLTGEAPAVRTHQGVLFQALHSIEVECLPLDLPQYVELDITPLVDFEQSIYVSDIALAESVTMITDSREMIARVSPPRVAVADEVAEAAEAEAGEEAAEAGEQPESGQPSG
ncbi:MAG: 50S ribosomal protein L25 [Dehalococcoidia bacterium]